MTSTLGAAAALLVAAAAAQPVPTVELSHCLDVAAGRARPDPGRCPGFVSEAFKGALAICGEAGGKLIPVRDAAIWQLDVNGDRKPEYLFELGANVDCQGAASVFQCGSLGCPSALYERKDDAWRVIGSLGVAAPDSIEVLAAEPGVAYRELRVGCAGRPPCDEFTHYAWGDDGYELSRYQVRGHWVGVGASAGRLRGLRREIAILATPAADSPVLDRYGADTEVVVLGDVPKTPYVYVSPCNACASGFVEETDLRP